MDKEYSELTDHPLWQAYVKSGFKQWQSETSAKLKLTPHFLQKRIMKNKDTLFFITVYVYDCKDHIGFQPEVQFNAHVGQHPCFEVIYNDEGNPSEVEIFFRSIYRQMHCEPYEKG